MDQHQQNNNTDTNYRPRSTSPYASGESGPRRTDACAANAEAARLARALGVASSSDNNTATEGGRSSSASSSSWFHPRRSSSSSQQRAAAGAEATSSSFYVRMNEDELENLDARENIHYSMPSVHISDNKTQLQHQPYLYDSHGQRAPYKEGPYFVSRAKDGRVIRKRWCEYERVCECMV
jgi:hypothetical protein